MVEDEELLYYGMRLEKQQVFGPDIIQDTEKQVHIVRKISRLLSQARKVM
jgi:hypothetical protein